MFLDGPYFISGIKWATFRNTFSFFVCRKQGHQSKEPVGDERGRGHGRSATRMIFVQRGKGESVLCYENYMSVLSSLMPLSPPLFWQEASELSSLKPQLEELGVPLVAVVKENIGTEIQDFRPHFAGDIYIDEQVSRTS